MEVQTGTGIQVLFYANYVSLSAMEKTLLSEGFTEEVLELTAQVTGHQVQKGDRVLWAKAQRCNTAQPVKETKHGS